MTKVTYLGDAVGQGKLFSVTTPTQWLNTVKMIFFFFLLPF